MPKSSLYDCSDAHILVSGTITITEAGNHAVERQADKRNKEVTFKNFVSFTDCRSKINNTQVDNVKDAVMPMCNIAIIIQNVYQEVYGSTIDMKQLEIIMAILLIFLVRRLRSNPR